MSLSILLQQTFLFCSSVIIPIGNAKLAIGVVVWNGYA